MTDEPTTFAPPKRGIPIKLFAALLLVDVLALLFEKAAVLQAGAAVGQELSFYIKLAQIPYTWLGILMAPLQLVVWTKILEKTDLSLAYPISSLVFPLTMISAWVLFREQMTPSVWAGAILITVGVAIVGGGSHHDERDKTGAPIDAPSPPLG